MFKEWYEYKELEQHPDERGNLFEVLRFKDWEIPAGGYVYCVVFAPGARRGDHYHERKVEWFSCVQGELTVLVEDKDGKKEKIILSAKNPAVIYFAPYTAHSFINTGTEPAIAIAYGSKQHDPADPDTIRKFIEYEGI
jgi:oxalate decarboxylase/phosphoglucose isomerase-like protein (cupin superfamily)